MVMVQRQIAPPPSYADLFGRAIAQLPGARNRQLKELREASFERFATLGFPGPKAEAWKYTSIGPLARQAFGLPSRVRLSRADIKPWLITDRHATRLVFVNGHFAADLSDNVSAERGVSLSNLGAALENGLSAELLQFLPDRDEGRSFSALNAAFTPDGGVIMLPDGASLSGPVQLLFVSVGQDEPALINPRNVIVLGDRARLSLVETHLTLGGGHNLTNLVNRFVLGRGAELWHDRLQLGEVSGSLIGRTEYEISADAGLTQTLATLGGALVRNEIDALLDGSKIGVQLNGLYLTRDRQHIDNMIRVEHAKPDSLSDQFYKGVLDGRAQAAFAGKIVVQRPAQKTNAYQTNNNLLLSPDAEINTKPELEIFADDVKCSHGATAGELDERELFYLRSRGLDPATARSMLTFAFAGEVLERFSNESVARQARREVLRWLPGAEALGELL